MNNYTPTRDASLNILTCAPCSGITSGCIICSDPSTCTFCDTNLNFVSNAVNGGLSCDCIQPNYVKDSNNNCISCSSIITLGPCIQCSTNSTCTLCANNSYAVNSNIC